MANFGFAQHQQIDFYCPTCTQIIKLHQLPQHQESFIPNTLQKLPNLQSLHSDVIIMPAYITAMQTEIAKLIEYAKQEVKE